MLLKNILYELLNILLIFNFLSDIYQIEVLYHYEVFLEKNLIVVPCPTYEYM